MQHPCLIISSRAEQLSRNEQDQSKEPSQNGQDMCSQYGNFTTKSNIAHYSEDKRTLCGFLLKNTYLQGNHNCWLEMQRVVIKTHTDVQNNAIKSMQTKLKGKPKQGNILAHGKTFRTNLCLSSCIKKVVIRALEELIGTPSTVDVKTRQLTSWK